MRTLFLKILLYFLLIIVLVIGLTMGLTYLRDQQFPLLAHQNFAKRALSNYGQEAMTAYEKGGDSELGKYLGQIRGETGILLALFDEDAQALAARKGPKWQVDHIVRQALSSDLVIADAQVDEKQGRTFAAKVESSSGKIYVVAVSLPGRPPSDQLIRETLRGFLGWQMLLLIGISALICFILARSLTTPISRLRQATRKFAGGDLSTRIGDQIKGKNELAGLAHDFDHMAAKIEDLISGQKQLLRDISHELRSPLARLGVALEIARNQSKPEGREKALARIECEAERMNEMIGQLLGLSRLESGSGQYRFERFDLGRLLDNLVQDAGFEAQKNQCRVELEAPEAMYYLGSEEQLAKALENVIRNAVKYSPEGGLVRVVAVQNAEQIDISVEDQGPGVPQEALERLFEPFYRVADARDRQSGGTGIGLAIAKYAVALHQGEIVAQNLDQGLRICVSLPTLDH
jgi:two-component system sensor histidine kinase CpxA